MAIGLTNAEGKNEAIALEIMFLFFFCLTSATDLNHAEGKSGAPAGCLDFVAAGTWHRWSKKDKYLN